MRRVAGIVVVLCLNAPASAEMFKIDNPASNIYNPADRMNDPNPLSPPTQPVPPPTVPKETTILPPATPPPPERVIDQRVPVQYQERSLPHKSYSFKTAKAYLAAADKAYNKGDYRRFLSISEEALNRIRAGTLAASKKAKQKLVRNRSVGRRLLEKGGR